MCKCIYSLLHLITLCFSLAFYKTLLAYSRCSLYDPHPPGMSFFFFFSIQDKWLDASGSGIHHICPHSNLRLYDLLIKIYGLLAKPQSSSDAIKLKSSRVGDSTNVLMQLELSGINASGLPEHLFLL